MLSSLRNGSKTLSACSKVDWSSALAASAQQTAGTVGTPYQNITSLLSLRNFTTEQRGTTVLCVRKLDKVVIMADGQVTRGNEIVKPNVKKVRKLNDSVIGGFAGATADAFTLFERLEMQLEQHPGQLTRAAVELAKLWRTDKYLRKLDAVMVVADDKQSLTITGNGDVLEPHDGIIAIGSGGSYALAASRALIDIPELTAIEVAKKAMTIAADTCIYTNHNFTTETLDSKGKGIWRGCMCCETELRTAPEFQFQLQPRGKEAASEGREAAKAGKPSGCISGRVSKLPNNKCESGNFE